MPNFKYELAYECKSKQEQQELFKALESIGYKVIGGVDYSRWKYILTEYTCSNCIGAYPSTTPDKIEVKNKDLFLALAHCTNYEYGIAGEWWKCVKPFNELFTENKLYKATKPVNQKKAFIDNKGFENGLCPDNLLYFTKASKEDLEKHFLFPDLNIIPMLQSQTITQEKLLYYLEQASKHKPKLVSVLMEQFPKVWEKEFVVTKNFYDFVVKEIGNCQEWQAKLKEDFPEFDIPKYNIEKGELCFVSDFPETCWRILRFENMDNKRYSVKHLDNHILSNYNYCVPMREVKAPHQIPVKGVHY